jgi:hypothetical protein
MRADAQYPAMRIDDPALYEQFVDARREAVELTDHYNDIAPTDPYRAELWQRVVVQTETARALLETWLQRRRVPAEVETEDRLLRV